MTNLKYTIEDVNEAFFNMGKMAGRLPADEGKRLAMLSQIISQFLEDVMEENKHLRGETDFDMDGRC
jgi:hypothetical protein